MIKYRIQCSHYTDYDELIINEATKLGLPLIGGTALEVLANYYNAPGVRKRSDNDLDFIIDDYVKEALLIDFIDNNIPSELNIKTDCYFVQSHDFHKYEMNVNGILVMKPEYLLWSKLIRGEKKDLQDIKWLLSISQMTDDDINNCLDDLGVTQQEFELLQSLL